MNLFLLTPPVDEPVSADEILAAQRIDGHEFDDVIPGLIAAARIMAEHETGRKLVTQTWRAEWSTAWPLAAQRIDLSPVSAVSVAAFDGSEWVQYPEAPFGVSVDRYGVEISPSSFFRLPTGLYRPVRLDVTCGEPVERVPESVKLWIKAQVGYWLRNPDAASEANLIPSPFLARLLDSMRAYL